MCGNFPSFYLLALCRNTGMLGPYLYAINLHDVRSVSLTTWPQLRQSLNPWAHSPEHIVIWYCSRSDVARVDNDTSCCHPTCSFIVHAINEDKTRTRWAVAVAKLQHRMKYLIFKRVWRSINVYFLRFYFLIVSIWGSAYSWREFQYFGITKSRYACMWHLYLLTEQCLSKSKSSVNWVHVTRTLQPKMLYYIFEVRGWGRSLLALMNEIRRSL